MTLDDKIKLASELATAGEEARHNVYITYKPDSGFTVSLYNDVRECSGETVDGAVDKLLRALAESVRAEAGATQYKAECLRELLAKVPR